MNKRLHFMKVIIFILVVTVGFSGCENLQKKFRRKKKNDTEMSNFVPVLVPEDYVNKDNSFEEKYKFHYNLLKVWYKDIYAAIEGKMPDKRQRNTLREIINQIEIMQSSLNDEKAAVMGSLKARLEKLDPLFDESVQLRNYSRITSELRQVEKVLRHEFKPDHVKESFRSNAS